jgi:FkbM family methyltransferase
LPAPAAPPFRFARLALPCGREYELSVEGENADTYHTAVGAGDLTDAERNALQNFHIVVGPVSDRPAFLSTFGASAWAEAKTDGAMMFPSVVIDDYVRAKSIGRIDVMKIDIEGSEKAALVGARGTIERDHPDIVIECNALTCGNHDHSYRELLGTLAGHGYRIYRIVGAQLAPWRPQAVQETIVADYLATTKQPEEIEARGGLPIRDLSDEQVLESLTAQDAGSAFHKQYSFMIVDRLPQRLREDKTVHRLTDQWKLLSDDYVLSVLRRGSA